MPQVYRNYNFKSVGNSIEEERQLNVMGRKDIVPIGMKTPLRFGGEIEGLFAMNYSLADQVADNLKNLILTNHGERLGLYYFGANIRELSYELTTTTADAEAGARIKRAVAKFMPYVELLEFIPYRHMDEFESVNEVGIGVVFNVPNINVKNRRINVTIYAVG